MELVNNGTVVVVFHCVDDAVCVIKTDELLLLFFPCGRLGVTVSGQ